MLPALKNALLALVVFVTLYLIARAPDYWLSFWRRVRYRGSMNWPIFQAAITEQRIDRTRERLRSRYQAVLIYSYNLSGNVYSGCFRSNKFDSKSDAERLLTKYPVNASVMVRVNPERAEDSLLVLPE